MLFTMNDNETQGRRALAGGAAACADGIEDLAARHPGWQFRCRLVLHAPCYEGRRLHTPDRLVRRSAAELSRAIDAVEAAGDWSSWL